MLSTLCKLSRLLCFGLFLSSASAFAQGDGKIDFVKTIKPIFEQHCLNCHGAEDPDAFRIDDKDEAMDYIDVDSAEDSNMFQVLISDDEDELMPPADEKNPLSAAQIAAVKTWISEGADWPDDVEWVTTTPPDAGPQSTTEDQTTVDGDADDVDPTNAGASQPVTPQPVAPKIDPKTQRIYDAIGSLHPAAVHLPIGLLLASGLFALFSLRGNFVMSDCAYYCLWLGTLGSVAGCISGWYFSPMEGKGTVLVLNDLWDQTHPVFWHRFSGFICTLFAFLLALFAASARNRDPDDGVMWKLGVILLALGISYVGHEGGELTHGKHHYDDLKAIGADLLPSVFGQPAAEEGAPVKAVPEAPKKATEPAQDETVDPEKEQQPIEEVGKTSDET